MNAKMIEQLTEVERTEVAELTHKMIMEMRDDRSFTVHILAATHFLAMFLDEYAEENKMSPSDFCRGISELVMYWFLEIQLKTAEREIRQ